MNLQFLNNHDISILGSGPSVENFHIDTLITILVNRSILYAKMDKFNIWIIEGGCYREDVRENLMDALEKSGISPEIIIVRRHVGRFEEEYQLIFNLLNNYTELPIVKPIVSSGALAIQLALQFNCSRIFIGGIEAGESLDYSSKIKRHYPDRVSGKNHLEEDMKFFRSLSVEERNKLFPVKNSGLFKLLDNK